MNKNKNKIHLEADVLSMFIEMNKEEGREEERKRIAEKLVNDKYCCIKFRIACTEDCVNCIEKYLEYE